MMQLGFVSAILGDLTLEEVFAVAKDNGYDCVELMCWPRGDVGRRYAGVTHVDVSDFSESMASEVKDMARNYGVQISGLGYYPNPLSPNEEEADVAIKHIYKVIDAAAMLGIKQANTFVGRDWTKSVDANWARFEETWKPIVEHAQRSDVRIGIENCPMIFSNDEWPGGKNLATTPAIWRRMYESIPSKYFGLNFDPSHFVWLHMDYLAPLREFADRIFHVHAKDVRVDQQRLDQVGIMANPQDYHVPKLPGLGDIDWGKFFSVLSDLGYQGPVCVEVEDRAYEGPIENRKASLQQSHTYLRNFIPAKS